MLTITHVVISILTAKLLGFDSIWCLAITGLFALIPDLDQPVGIGKLNPFSKYIYAKFGHRNITHSLIFALLTTSFLAINQTFWISALIGILSHFASDMLTYTGIPLLWPIKKNFVIFNGPLLTGSWHELFIIFASALGVILLW